MKRYAKYFIALLIAVIAGTTAIYAVRTESKPETTGAPQGGTVTIGEPSPPRMSLNASNIVSLHNDYRVSKGLTPLAENNELDKSAQLKAQHMVDNNYWSHVASDGTQPWKFYELVGYTYTNAGENLSYNNPDPQGVVDAWIRSPEHEKNMSGDFSDMGVGILQNVSYQNLRMTTVVVVHFGTPR